MDKVTDKVLLPAMVAPEVIAVDSLSRHRPLAPLLVPTLSASTPIRAPQGSWVQSHNSLTNDWILNRRLWQWFSTVDTDRSGHISVVELR